MKIKTHKRLHRTLFNWTIQNWMHIFPENPLFSSDQHYLTQTNNEKTVNSPAETREGCSGGPSSWQPTRCSTETAFLIHFYICASANRNRYVRTIVIDIIGKWAFRLSQVMYSVLFTLVRRAANQWEIFLSFHLHVQPTLSTQAINSRSWRSWFVFSSRAEFEETLTTASVYTQDQCLFWRKKSVCWQAWLSCTTMVHSEPFRQYDTYKTIRLYYQTEQQNVFQALALRNERLTFQRIKKQ